MCGSCGKEITRYFKLDDKVVSPFRDYIRNLRGLRSL